MGIRNIPECYKAFAAYHRDYEATHYSLAESNRRADEATRELLAWLPVVCRRIRLRTRLPHRTYPQGWVMEDLGPRWIVGRCTRDV